MKKLYLGWKPSPALAQGIALLIQKREPDEVIVVHHYADTPAKLQIEFERNSKVLGLSFERLILENHAG